MTTLTKSPYSRNTNAVEQYGQYSGIKLLGVCAVESSWLRAIPFWSLFLLIFVIPGPLNSSIKRKNRLKMESLSLRNFYRADSQGQFSRPEQRLFCNLLDVRKSCMQVAWRTFISQIKFILNALQVIVHLSLCRHDIATGDDVDYVEMLLM